MEKTPIQVLPELVKRQLQQILQQEELQRSPILSKFLEFVVLSRLEGREDEIKEYTIGIKALGKPLSFSPQLDAAVRIHATRLRNILFKYYHGAGQNDLIFIDIPKGSYIPVFETNDSKSEVLKHFVKSQAEINLSERQSSKARRRDRRPVLAVLPFHDHSPKGSNHKFLISLAEQLTTELARFDNIATISYYATQNFDAERRNIRDLQKDNSIDYVLTGSLRLLNGVLRLNIQLLMVDTGNILWSDSFQRNDFSEKNTMDIQDEMISQIANVVADDHGMVGTLNKLKPWKNSEENDVVNRGIIQYFEYTYNYDSKKFGDTLQMLEMAYQSDDDNALVAAILGKMYLDQYACSVERDQGLLEKGLELAKRSVELDSRSQHAQKALAWGLVLSGQKEKSSEVIDRCIAINPTAASNLGTMGLGLIMQGEYENGFSMMSKALQLTQNPSACVKLGLALYYYRCGNYAESKKWLDRLAPFEFPFGNLLSIAIQGKTTGKFIQTSEVDLVFNGQQKDIVDRIVFDNELKNQIAEGWDLAGYTLHTGTLLGLSA